MLLRRKVAVVAICLLSLAGIRPAAAASDIILRTSDFTNLHGNWAKSSSTAAADGQYIGSADYGWGTANAPLPQPNDYFEASFTAPAGTPFHVWFRVRATGNSKYNDSVWVQYSDAVASNGTAVYRVGTASALDVNLERCSGCGTSGWGWQDGAYWLSQATTIRFAATGTHTLRVQIREDGAQIDQIVLSPATYLFASPGSMTGDTVIVPRSGATSISAGPYLGSPVSLPGRVEAENFDQGADSVSYHDSTAGNSGNTYRQTNADIEACADGGYDLGWTASGEWLNYAVKTASAGAYTVKLRVASPGGGGALHLGFNGPSSVWKSVGIPATGGWQAWTTISVPVTLGAGSQLITIAIDAGGFNLNYIEVVSGATTTQPTSTPTPTPTPSGGSSVSVVTWNVQINDSSAAHAQRAIDYVMAMTPQPRIVVLQEAHKSQFYTYLAQLQTRSGQAWRGVFATHCPPGAWNGSSCTGTEDEGVVVFSSLPVVDSSTRFLSGGDQWHSARGSARLAVSVNGVVLQVFGAHLPLSVSARASAMSALKSFASGYSAPQLAAGDFNAGMDEIDPGMSPNFVDSWKLCGSGNGYTAFTGSPSMKLDYWLADAGGRAKPDWSVVVTATGTFSDHYPVINSFTVR
jgi:endonuclease/exonuclease/phosphatase family metal-dependent hydrolase